MKPFVSYSKIGSRIKSNDFHTLTSNLINSRVNLIIISLLISLGLGTTGNIKVNVFFLKLVKNRTEILWWKKFQILNTILMKIYCQKFDKILRRRINKKVNSYSFQNC